MDTFHESEARVWKSMRNFSATPLGQNCNSKDLSSDSDICKEFNIICFDFQQFFHYQYIKFQQWKLLLFLKISSLHTERLKISLPFVAKYQNCHNTLFW